MSIIFNLIPLVKYNTFFFLHLVETQKKSLYMLLNVPFDRQDQPQKQINNDAANFAGDVLGFYLMGFVICNNRFIFFAITYGQTLKVLKS